MVPQVTKLSFKYPTEDPFLLNNRTSSQLGQFCELALTELGQRNCFPNPAGTSLYRKHRHYCELSVLGGADGPFMGDGATRSFDENMNQLINMITIYSQQWHTGAPALRMLDCMPQNAENVAGYKMTQIWPRPFYPSHILAYLEAKCKYDFFYSKHEGFGKETIMNVKQKMDQMGKTGCAEPEMQ